MPHALAQAVEIVTTALAVAGMGYFLAALVAARVFLLTRRAPRAAVRARRQHSQIAQGARPRHDGRLPQPLPAELRRRVRAAVWRGVARRSGCRGSGAIAGRVSRAGHPAARVPAAAGSERQGEHAGAAVAHAQHDFLLINDSDITVSPHYLERVMCCFAPETAGQPGMRQADPWVW